MKKGTVLPLEITICDCQFLLLLYVVTLCYSRYHIQSNQGSAYSGRVPRQSAVPPSTLGKLGTSAQHSKSVKR